MAQKAQEKGYNPEIILAGRQMNIGLGEYVFSQVVKLMIKKGISILGSELLILGITFKENCPDVRYTKIVDVISSLESYGIRVTIYDSWSSPEEVMHEYKMVTSKQVPNMKFDAIILGMAHNEYLTFEIDSLKRDKSIIYDVKGILESAVNGRL